jgi:acetaldehyde dehydrogenase (acetylating)
VTWHSAAIVQTRATRHKESTYTTELSTPAELGAAVVGKVYSEESCKGENILHVSCAFKRKVA